MKTDDRAAAAATVPLSVLLRSAATELAASAPPADLERRMLAATHLGPGLPVQASRRAPWAWAIGTVLITACLLLSLVLTLGPPPAEAEGGFLALVPTERWPADGSAAWVVKAELSGERLAALGLPFDPARAGERIPAELLLHASGEVLAVRFTP